MKIIRLSPDRIRVLLTESDLLERKIDIGEISPGSPVLNIFLREILDAVREETGFSLSDGGVLAEATPESGGIILDLSHTKEENKEGAKEHKPVKRDSVLFEFSGFEELSAMLRNIHIAYLLNMRLYSFNEKFYMAVPKRRAPGILYEYSLKNNRSSVAESKVAEHGRLIAGGYRLVYMASALKKIN